MHIAVPGIQALGGGREDVGARVADLVDAMAEAHQLFSRLDLSAQHRLGARRIADLEHHVERRSGSAAVQRTFECADSSDNRGYEIRARGGDDARRECRRVESVIDDRVEIRLHRVDALGRGNFSVEHVEIVRSVRQIAARRDRLLLVQKAPIRGDDRRESGEWSASEPGGGSQRIHRIVFSRRCRAQNVVRNRLQLAFAIEQLADAEDADGFLESRVRGEVLDGVSADDQLAAFAVDHADRRFGRDNAL